MRFHEFWLMIFPSSGYIYAFRAQKRHLGLLHHLHLWRFPIDNHCRLFL